MIVNRGVTRMKIRRTGGRIFILLFTLATALKSVICVSTKNSSTIENTSNCGGEYSGYQYTIGSPNYPKNYPENQDCVYILRGSRLAKCEQVFHLQFLDFSLPPSENCDQDYLEIGRRSVYCGRVVGIRRYPGKNNSLTLRFHTASGRGGKGFKILVTTSQCFDPQIGKQNHTYSTERSATKGTYKATTKNINNNKIGALNNPETVDLLEAESSYPIYHPEIDFTVEDIREDEEDYQTPLKIESLGKNEKNTLISVGPVNSFQLPVRDSYSFTNVPNVFLNNNVDNLITPPPTELILPSKSNAVFRESGVTHNTGKLVENQQRVNQKFIVPARSYGVPSVAYYSPTKVSESDTKTGEVFENSSGNADCEGKNEPDLEVTANFRDDNPNLIDNIGSSGVPGFRSNYYPATNYGPPGLSYPANVPKVNVGFTPSSSYGPPAGNYPGNVIESVRPNDWLPSANFVPSSGNPNNDNVGNRYPNFFPNPGSGPGTIYPGTGGEYSQCCKIEYSAQRFLLASPGFPSLLYSGNSYECVYSIRPFSSNICQIRFNFHFFNHGTEDGFCTNGYIEIDGRRICGCKRGLSIVSPVVTSYPKVMRVRYTGYPRTKFNGFLIEVIQEPCSNSYPYLSRSKKDVGNSTHEIVGFSLEVPSGVTNSPSNRTKRNLGYSYPKPNFGLSEEPGFSWNSGSTKNTGIHQVFNQGGIGGNIFAPISSCQALSFFDWVNAAKDVYLRGGRCVRNEGSGNGVPGYPGSWVPGQWPGYPGNGGSGTIIPGYPGNGGSGSTIPGYPGSGGSGSNIPGYPDSGGSGSNIPGYPGSGGSGSNIPGYPGSGGSGSTIPGYPGSGGWNFPSSKCEVVNVNEGIISSPQYPTNYPNNVYKCYRFYKAPESCQLELAFLDFDLENSPRCSKDYVAFSRQNRRYCGRSLAGSESFLDISRTNVVDMYFVSDGYGSGRGFSVGFSQIRCRGL